MRKTVSGIMLTLLLIGMLTLVFNIQLVKASGTIYIRADGSIEGTDKIISADNVTYTFIDNIYDSIVVERNNIVVDGAGYILQGAGSGTGIDLSYRKNVTIKNMDIKLFYDGIKLAYSLNNSISGNTLTANWVSGIELKESSFNSISGNDITERHSYGIKLDGSSNNTISGNDITENGWGIKLSTSNNNTISGNNIAANEQDTIKLWKSSNNSIYENNIANNQMLGIMLSGSSNYNSIKGNNIANNGFGIRLHSSLENSVSGNNITDHTYYYGIKLEYSLNYSISGNNIANNCWGIVLEYSSNCNSIYGNDITKNEYGIWLWNSSNNRFYHNSFNNTVQVVPTTSNVWDNGYPSGGNYWSAYTGVDEKSGSNQDQPGSDGIGDAEYSITFPSDRYPLMGPFSTFDAGTWDGTAYNVDVVSNSTVSDFQFNPSEGALLRFNVTGEDGTSGFCRVTIPKSLLWVEDGWTILVGDQSITDYRIIPDENYTYLYLTYNHSTKTVQIQGTHVIPEFPSTMILPLFILTTLITMILLKKKRKTKPQLP